MKSNRITWGLVALIVSVTLAISFGTTNSHSQKDTSKEQDKSLYRDLSKYAIVDYDAPESVSAVEREERNLKNKRYDKQGLVVKNPQPGDGGVSVEDEVPPPPIMPIAESDLIVIGEILSANAYLSNDKSGVYTEFAIRVEETLKNKNANDKINRGDSITADRIGGIVQYPNGQKLFYRNDGDDLPHVGGNYILFLTSDERSPNYKVFNGQELTEEGIIPLDTERRFDEFKDASKQNFIRIVRNKITELSTSKESRRKQ